MKLTRVSITCLDKKYVLLYKYASILNLTVFIFLDAVIDDGDNDDYDDDDDDGDDFDDDDGDVDNDDCDEVDDDVDDDDSDGDDDDFIIQPYI